MLHDQTKVEAFVDFVNTNERRLRQALTASLGPDAGKDAAAEALAYGWEHWDRVRAMGNPVGYLFVVGRSKARRLFSPIRPVFPPVPEDRTPWIEPGLAEALGRLPERQRIVILLLHGYEWHLAEIAETLGVTVSTVQTHAERAMRRLRRALGVDQ